ncbi:uncharacterized protein LOC101855681 [Aplysia californica]|uniref:Uncharacterized protein LOC101855681 n=1 Tax=Aplysia californica TaxID=6500 RepID=A0ABM1ABW8_APLCA|nr:uncharacterized protein LOC101855681 [Aplysia californica]
MSLACHVLLDDLTCVDVQAMFLACHVLLDDLTCVDVQAMFLACHVLLDDLTCVDVQAMSLACHVLLDDLTCVDVQAMFLACHVLLDDLTCVDVQAMFLACHGTFSDVFLNLFPGLLHMLLEVFPCVFGLDFDIFPQTAAHQLPPQRLRVSLYAAPTPPGSEPRPHLPSSRPSSFPPNYEHAHLTHLLRPDQFRQTRTNDLHKLSPLYIQFSSNSTSWAG